MTVRVCGVDDVPLGEGRTARVGGEEIAVFRAAGGWFAVQGACPHAGGPLADGIVASSSVICPLHERRFDLASGAAVGHSCPALRTHRVEVRGDDVLLTTT